MRSRHIVDVDAPVGSVPGIVRCEQKLCVFQKSGRWIAEEVEGPTEGLQRVFVCRRGAV